MTIYTEQEIRNVPDDSEELQQYKMIVAAGGVVVNQEGQVLMIFRRGKWDLPKGKREDDEPVESCASRETMEETGLKEIELKRSLGITYHTYVEKKNLTLKETHWFLFAAPGVPELTPQIEEDIFKTEWVNREDLGDYLANTFRLVIDVLGKADLLPAGFLPS